MPVTSQPPRQNQLEDLLGRVAAKERAKIEKHLVACDGETDSAHADVFRRLVTMLDSRAGAGVDSVGGQAWRFFVPDGKYRLQVFALEDRGDGTLRVFLPDVLASALKGGVVAKTAIPNEYTLKGAASRPVHIETIDQDKPEPPAHVKSMLGWGRKAIAITIPVTGPVAQVNVAEALCTLAAKKWTK
jgi:hypothetical protein